jgi:hypothetical protein
MLICALHGSFGEARKSSWADIALMLGDAIIHPEPARGKEDLFYEKFPHLASSDDEDEPAPSIPSDYNCDQSINFLIQQVPDTGSIFYALLNGWYLGMWADYASCLGDTNGGQYVFARISGTYNGDFQWTRGGIGKYEPDLVTRVGICMPSTCTEAEIDYYLRDYYLKFAEGTNWTDTSISYNFAS